MDIVKFLIGDRQASGAGLPSSLTWNLYNGMWTPPSLNDKLYIDRAYKAIPIVQSIVSEIIEKASEAPPQIMRKKNDGAAKQYMAHRKSLVNKSALKGYKVKAFEQLTDHPSLELFENPNSYMSGVDLRQELFGYLLITGNFIEYAATTGVGKRGNIPVNLYPIPSPCVTLKFGDNRSRPVEGYYVSYNGEELIPASKITHGKYFNPVSATADFRDSFWGLSPLRSFRNTIGHKTDADIAQGSLFKNMTPAGMVVGNGSEGYGELTEEQGVQINDHFRENHMGVHNAGDILVTPANVRWEAIGLSPIDLQLLDWNKDIERQIANAYRYPAEMIEASAIVANSEIGSVKFIRNCIQPLLAKFDAIRTKKLREWYGDPDLIYMSDLEYYPELQENKKELVSWMRNAGVFEQGEIREACDYQSEYDPSKVLVPVNYMFESDLRDQDEEEVEETNE